MTAKASLLSSMCLTKSIIKEEGVIPSAFWKLMYNGETLILWECNLSEHKIMEREEIKLCISAFNWLGEWTLTYYWSWLAHEGFTKNAFSEYIVKKNYWNLDKCNEAIEVIKKEIRLNDYEKFQNPKSKEKIKNFLNGIEEIN